MKLYYSPGACSLSPHIVLHESGLPFTGVLASTKTKKLQDGTDFHTINELGYVPVLELDNGERLREGPAIVQYLADQVPGKYLAPANGTMARYQLQSWLNFIGTEIHKSCTPFFSPLAKDDWKGAARANLDRRLGLVNEHLADKPYLMGDDFTVADGYLFTVTNWAKPMHIDLSGLKNLGAYRERIAARPAVQRAMTAEGLI